MSDVALADHLHNNEQGCKRCKARKVKVSRFDLPVYLPHVSEHIFLTAASPSQCDEQKPRCGACTRHKVPCEYSASPYDSHTPSDDVLRASEEHYMELRLLHEWMARTCMSLSTTWQFWKEEAPLIAMEFRHVLDAMLAVTALHTSRQKPRVWSGLEGRMIELEHGADSLETTPTTENTIDVGWKATNRVRRALAGHPAPEILRYHPVANRSTMLQLSRNYFARALEGHQKALADLRTHNIRATFLSSILICYYSLFTLSEEIEDSLMLDPLRWFRLSRGTTLIISKWQQLVGDAWVAEAGGMYGEPDLSDSDELFRKEHQFGFEYLLASVDGDHIRPEDREAYEHSLSYFGTIYKGIVNGTDSPLATGRRIIAMPAIVPARFCQLVEILEPRATAILAHVFGTMKLSEKQFPWLKGIAQRQVPLLCYSLPSAWMQTVEWPLQVVKGDVTTIPPQAL